MNRDGFVNKKEFQWMTTNTILSQKKIDTMFKVFTISSRLSNKQYAERRPFQRCDLDGDGKLNYDEFIRYQNLLFLFFWWKNQLFL